MYITVAFMNGNFCNFIILRGQLVVGCVRTFGVVQHRSKYQLSYVGLSKGNWRKIKL